MRISIAAFYLFLSRFFFLPAGQDIVRACIGRIADSTRTAFEEFFAIGRNHRMLWVNESQRTVTRGYAFDAERPNEN